MDWNHKETFNKTIESTYLKTDLKPQLLDAICTEALKEGFHGVCIPPSFVKYCKEQLKGQAKTITVIGFPLGYTYSSIKVAEAMKAIEEGAEELDVVINLLDFKSNQDFKCKSELHSILGFAHFHSVKIKWIIESGQLNNDEIKRICTLANELDLDFIKTSTGYNGEGATVEKVSLLRKLLKPEIQIKASGGIKTRQQALELLEAGASRIGTSSALQLL